MTEPLLIVENLTKTFRADGREFAALKGVSLRLDPGETLGVVGESGSGKSTLARLICRFDEPDGGTIRLAGEDITHARPRELRAVYRRVQMVFQSPAGSFDPRRTLGDGIGESLRSAGLPRAERAARVAALLARCGLPAEFASRYPHQVSGGECQRAAIARALAPGPRLLVCDEATGALDVTVQRQIMTLLTELRRADGLSCLFICHDLALAQSFCDRLMVMRDGLVVETGPADEVINFPRNDYTRRLVEAAT